MPNQRSRNWIYSLVLLAMASAGGDAARGETHDFDTFLKPLVTDYCSRCHGGKKPKGKLDLKAITTAQQLVSKPMIIKNMIEAIEANDMPPEDEKQFDKQTRQKVLLALNLFLREAASQEQSKPAQIRRLNRFQYNNSVRDLFQLKMDVFKLSEKLMTRHSNYLNITRSNMPGKVEVASHSLSPLPGLRDVNAFPKDLRAAHGFDNQANQLTLSPLLLDAFFRLSVSIVESPDFNEPNVGIWNDFFKEPAPEKDKRSEVRQRLDPFLALAFRGQVEPGTIDRYTAYAMSQLSKGLSFTDSMKKVASAILSSPLFLYRSETAAPDDKPFQLAARLSYFLWGSGPDRELLQLAKSGELAKSVTLNKTISRMLADPKIERFLDSFPSQWMQLENALAATPDPKINRLFSLDKSNPASVQMVLEPLLLFDAVFIENRPIVELITPTFSYQSDFLNTWYTTDLKPPKVDQSKLVEENRINDERCKSLTAAIQTTKSELDAINQATRSKLLAARKKDTAVKKPVDLKPYAAWEFDGDLKDTVGSLDLKAHGKIQFENGMVHLNRSYLISSNLQIDLKGKSLEVWCNVPDLNQRGGGVMGIQGPGDFFDTIVLGERKPMHWISGSNGFSRTKDFPESTPETKTNQLLHLVMVYEANGQTTLYRDGQPYGKPYRKGSATFPKNQTSVLFGLRHLPAGGNKHLNVSIDRAKLYDRALTPAEVASANTGNNLYVSEKELVQALTPEQRTKREALSNTLKQDELALKRVPKVYDPKKAKQETQRRFDNDILKKLRSREFNRVPVSDPRYGGVITNAAMLSMTSGPKRTHPIARGAWIIEVIFNDPPPPPPNDVPPLNEAQTSKKLTIREKFAIHRDNPSCAGCHSRLDPLGFAMESYDITGRWRDKYPNGRDVDASGTLIRKHPFKDAVDFKKAIVSEKKRFAKAFTAHLLRFALARELTAADAIAVDDIVKETESEGFKLRSLIRGVILSGRFTGFGSKAPQAAPPAN